MYVTNSFKVENMPACNGRLQIDCDFSFKSSRKYMDICCKGSIMSAASAMASVNSSAGHNVATNHAANPSAVAAGLARVAASSLAKNLLLPTAPQTASNVSVPGVTHLQNHSAAVSIANASALSQHVSAGTASGSLLHYNPAAAAAAATLLQNGAAGYRHDVGSHTTGAFGVHTGAAAAAAYQAHAPHGLSLIYPQVAAAAAAAYQVCTSFCDFMSVPLRTKNVQ